VNDRLSDTNNNNNKKTEIYLHIYIFTYLRENISKIKSLEQNPSKNGIPQTAKLETIKHEEVKGI
jgi:hypothetical protein